jgi:PAS domain S-box-containing protein
MIGMRGSLPRKLTAMNLLVSGVALLLASAAFFAYDLITFRANLITSTSVQARMIGSNAVSPLVFNDPGSIETTLTALRASTHINYAAVYTADGQYFSGYFRDPGSSSLPLPQFYLSEGEKYWFADGRFNLLQTILFEDRPVGIVYIRSDLDAIYDRLSTYSIILLVILIASLVAALAISRLTQRVITVPILGLADTARRVSRDKDYSIRVRPTSERDEVATLVTAFNEMLLEIQTRDSALQESEQQFRSLADSIPQLAWMADSQGNLFWYNRRWYEFTGTTPAEMEGWGWAKVHDPELLPQVIEKWKISLATGKSFEMTFPLRGADGSYRYFLTLATPVFDAHGEIARWFGTNTDVTEQRLSAEALRQTEKLAATGRLAASIAHEINNPLEAVTNLVYLSRKQPANAEKYLSLADNELDRIAQITKNTLGFYRDSASPSEVNIPEVLQEVLALYVRKLNFKKIHLRNEPTEGAKVIGYPGEIRQIFANLISNAIEALPNEGCLHIRTTKVHSSDGTRRPGVQITFFDNGSGVAPENRKKIFEPFFTTKKDVGTGLGLWLTQGLVEKHKGVMRVRSRATPGRSWTAFSVFLPESP